MEIIENIVEALRGLFAPPVANLSDPNVRTDPNAKGGKVVAVREGYSLHRLEGPVRSRRCHTFTTVPSFADWLKRYAKPGTTEILVGDENVQAVLNGLEDQADLVTLALQCHPVFEAFDAALGKPLSHRDLLLLVRAYRDAVRGADVLLAGLAQLKHAKGDEITTHIDPQTGAVRFAGTVRNNDIAGQVPSSIVIETPIWNAVKAGPEFAADCLYPIEILVTLETEPHLHFVLSCPALDLVLLQARGDVQAHLEHALGEEFLVGGGKLQIQSVHRSEEF